ncbi:28299_t:CDS:1, partial [Racocetra persica]
NEFDQLHAQNLTSYHQSLPLHYTNIHYQSLLPYYTKTSQSSPISNENNETSSQSQSYTVSNENND